MLFNKFISLLFNTFTTPSGSSLSLQCTKKHMPAFSWWCGAMVFA